jgi:cytochrome c oxidase subunit 2
VNNKFWCWFFIFWPIAAVVACAISPAMKWGFPGDPQTPIGAKIDDLYYMILIVVVVVFIGTQIAFGYVLWRGIQHREGEKAWFTHGSHILEATWSAVPAIILLFISLYQLDVWASFRVQSHFPEKARLAPIAEVTARQFEWRIRYPHPGREFKNQQQVNAWLQKPAPDDLYTVNDLRVPAAEDVVIHLRSGDVQHSFFVPALRVKQDALPGQIIPIHFFVNKTGEYDLTCAELCGWGHYKMRGRVLAQSRDEYEKYLEQLERDQSFDGTKPSDEESEE